MSALSLKKGTTTPHWARAISMEDIVANTVDAVKGEQEEKQERLRKRLEKARKKLMRLRRRDLRLVWRRGLRAALKTSRTKFRQNFLQIEGSFRWGLHA